MSRICRLAVVAAVVVGTTIAWQQPALAACHAFTIAASPASVAEGGTVTVTVARDAGVNPSSIQVSSVNETAQAGADFPTVQRTVSFTTETQQTFTVAVTDDTAAEPAETFRLHLSNPGGCPVNTNFVIGADARITILANDTAPPTTPPPPPPPPSTAPPTTAARSTTTTAASETTTSTTPAPPSSSSSSSTSSTTTEADTTTTSSDEEALGVTEDDDGGGSGLGAIAVLAAALVLGGVGYLLYRRRSSPAG